MTLDTSDYVRLMMYGSTGNRLKITEVTKDYTICLDKSLPKNKNNNKNKMHWLSKLLWYFYYCILMSLCPTVDLIDTDPPVAPPNLR